MSRTKKFLKNTISTAMLQIVNMIIGFILPKIMLTVYGSEINGLVTSITQLISYLTLVEAGLSGATVYSLYKPLAEENKNEINSILSAAKKFYFRTGYLFLGLIVGTAFLYPLFVQTKALESYEVVVLFFVLGVNGVLEFFTLAKYRALLTADQKTYVISLASILQNILNMFIVAILSYMRVNIVIVRLVAIIAIILRTIILWAYCKKKYQYLDFSVEPNNVAMEKRWDALFLQIVGIIHTGAPVVIATIFLSLNDVSIYSVYSVIYNGVGAILGIFSSGLSSAFGDLVVRGEKEKFKEAVYQFEYIYYILITIVYSVMLVMYIPFIRIYTEGADINYIYPLFAVLLTINGFFYNLKTPYGMLTIAEGKYRESRIQLTIMGLLEIVCGAILSIPLGLNGIVIGSIISNAYRDIDFIFFAPKYLTGFGFKKSLFMWIRSIVLLFILSYLSTYLVPTNIENYKQWFLCGIKITGVITTIVLCVCIVTDFKLFKKIIIRFKGIIR